MCQGTKSRRISIGVERRRGLQKRFPEGPMGTRMVVFGLSTESEIGMMSYGRRDALSDNASHNTLTIGYFIVWEKKEISFRRWYH